MAVVSPSQGSQLAIQDAFRQLRVQQAKQNAERAEMTAQALAGQAAQAQRTADLAQENARNLTVRASQAKSVAGQARQGIALQQSVSEMQVNLYNTAGQVSSRLESDMVVPLVAEVPTVTQADVAPVLNSSGQLTGTVVNTTA